MALNGAQTSLAEAARRTGLHRSTAHHLLQTLVSLGYLRQDAETRAYELAAKPFQLTGRTWSPEQLAAIAQPCLAELTRRSGEGSSFSVYRDGAVTVVAKREHDGPVRVVQDVGARRPLHCTAVAKAILPWLPAPELAGLLARMRFARHTPKTIVTRAAFEAELRRIRTAGLRDRRRGAHRGHPLHRDAGVRPYRPGAGLALHPGPEEPHDLPAAARAARAARPSSPRNCRAGWATHG